MKQGLKSKVGLYILSWRKRGYPDVIPDEAPIRLEQSGRVPSYRMICIAIMKNDLNLQYLGFSRPPCELYNELKRQELIAKGKITPNPQRKLFQ